MIKKTTRKRVPADELKTHRRMHRARVERLSRGLSQGSVCKELDIQGSVLSRLENYGEIPRKATREKIAAFYGITFEELAQPWEGKLGE